MYDSIDGVCEITMFGPSPGAGSARDSATTPPVLVIEIPHGATRTAEYRALRAMLNGEIASNLVDFFHVNTDVGAPELGAAVAEAFAAANPGERVCLVRCRIPRTFIDCNRVIDVAPEFYKEGRVTPGVPPWIRDPGDLALLRGLHGRYAQASAAIIDATCAAGGRALFLHTYAPRSVDVEVNDDIVANLHHAYLPDVEPTWPLRAEVDIIGRGLDGTLHVGVELLAALVEGYGRLGITVADGQTYPMHPSTLAYHHTVRHPGRTVCVEVRRDLLADPFTPFEEMRISAPQAIRLAAPLAAALAVTIAPVTVAPVTVAPVTIVRV